MKITMKKYLLYPYPKSKPKPKGTSRRGIKKDDEFRTGLKINTELLNKIRALVYWERIQIRDIIEKAVTEYVYKEGSVELKNPPQERTWNKETRTGFITKDEFYDKLKALAYWERETVQRISDKALKTYINKYESKNGIIKPKPKPKKR